MHLIVRKFNVADRLYILSLARLTSPDYSVVRHAWYFVQHRQSVQARQRGGEVDTGYRWSQVSLPSIANLSMARLE